MFALMRGQIMQNCGHHNYVMNIGTNLWIKILISKSVVEIFKVVDLTRASNCTVELVYKF